MVKDDSPASQPLPTHVFFILNRNADEYVDGFRAHIVADENHQTISQDYMGAYAPVVPFSLLPALLYLMVCLEMFVAQF